MKITRSTKLSLKFATASKQKQVDMLCREYGNVVNFFIEQFQHHIPKKSELKKDIYNLPDTWLSAALRQIAAREAVSILESWSKQPAKKRKNLPRSKGTRIPLTQACVHLQESKKSSQYEMWVHISNVGNGLILDLPLQPHHHFKELQRLSEFNKTITLTKKGIQLSTTFETGAKRTNGESLALDTNMTDNLAVGSNGSFYGEDVHRIIAKIQRKQHGSQSQKRARKELKQYMNTVAKSIVEDNDNLRMLFVENLKGIKQKTKVKRRLTKNMRRSVGIWAVAHFHRQLESRCERNRVSFRRVSPYKTSITCPECDHTDRGNRAQRDVFECVQCGYVAHADYTASRNILARGLRGELYWNEIKELIPESETHPLANFTEAHLRVPK